MALCDDLEGWGGGVVAGRLRKEGIYEYMWLIHDVVQQKLTPHHSSFKKWKKNVIFQNEGIPG